MWYSDVVRESGNSASEVKFEVLSNVTTKISVFCDVQACS